METKAEIIKKKIDKLKDKYPNIITMWKKYIDVKTKSLNKAMDECIKILNKLENDHMECDIPKNIICLMYLLNNTI